MASVDEDDWDALLDDALSGNLDIAFQPVINLQLGDVAGYEALARFRGLPAHPPDLWFAAARQREQVAELEAVVVRKVLAARKTLPRDCFLSLNVEPDSLGHPALDEALHSIGRLDGVVVEITEHAMIENYEDMERELFKVRSLGALIALDDAGSGHAGLQHMLRLRPAIIKVDRALVEGVHLDAAKRALIEMIGLFASKIDAWLLVEGIEEREEAATMQGLHVPLAQGYFFGRPTASRTDMTAEAQRFFVDRPLASHLGPTVHEIIGSTPSLPHSRLEEAVTIFANDPSVDWLVIVDDDDRPLGLVDQDSALIQLAKAVLHVNVSTPVLEIAHRMLTRPPGECFRPVICHDDLGRYVGTIAPERVLDAVASLADQAAPSS